MSNNNNIKDIASSCTRCGACKVFCPSKCIQYTFNEADGHYRISVESEKCTQCGICKRICPVSNKATGEEYENFFKNGKEAFATYSKNDDIRTAAASGGFITTFLCYLLKEGIIDGALVSRRKGICGESFIARSVEEIISAKTSIYAPVNYSKGIEELRKSDCERIVVVGLPCHIQAISNIRKINKKINNKILLTISIVCGKTPSTNAYRYIAQKNRINYDSITNVSNRGGGWPGFMTIKHGAGEFKVPYRSKMSMGMVLSSPLLCGNGCNACVDGYGIGADISVCDAWLKKYTSQDSAGWNLILAQSAQAKELLKDERITKYLHLETESTESFYKANRRVIEKYLLNNTFLQKEFRIELQKKPNIKQRLYSSILNILYFIKERMKQGKATTMLIYTGKVINKLKD